MDAYANWEDFIIYLKGREPSMPSAEFDFWAEMATDTVDQATFGRIDEAVYEQYRREIVRATCALADFYFVPAALDEYRGLKSVSVTGHSVSLDDRKQADKDTEARAILRRHLGQTGLLYRGV